jgi:proteasome lid subunit RPN8/RPN11
MLSMSREHIESIFRHAFAGLPNETCGLLAGERDEDHKIVKKVYFLKNIDESPEHFSMEPQEQFRSISDMRRLGLVLLGNFHSHPSSPARPSDEDIRLAFDPTLSYLIVSLKDGKPQMASFLIQNGTFSQENFRVQNNAAGEL